MKDVPRSLDKFQELKYNGGSEWAELKESYGQVRSREILKERIKNGEITLTLNKEKQEPHMAGTKGEGKSYFTISMDELQAVLNEKCATGTVVIKPNGQIKENIDFDKDIGYCVDKETKEERLRATVHYSKKANSYSSIK